MTKNLPHLLFESQKPNNIGIEILTIESLFERKDYQEHNPEKAHQVAFNMIVFYTEGVSKYLVDFVWHPVKKKHHYSYF